MFGIMAWGGLWLRDPKLRAILPFHRGRSTRRQREKAAGHPCGLFICISAKTP